jgi:hypothetical protein
LSFGYMVTADREADDGIKELLGIDLFEVTITPIPANPATRFLSLNGFLTPDRSETLRRERAEAYAEFKNAYERRKQTKARNERPISIATFEVG